MLAQPDTKIHSPLSKWAITRTRLEPGLRVIILDIHRGILHRGVFVDFDEGCTEEGDPTGPKLVFKWDDANGGTEESWYPEDAGLTPDGDGNWNPTNFTIKEADFVNLPRIVH